MLRRRPPVKSPLEDADIGGYPDAVSRSEDPGFFVFTIVALFIRRYLKLEIVTSNVRNFEEVEIRRTLQF